MQLIIYAATVTPRLQYISSTISAALGFTSVQITTSTHDYLSAAAAKINYSNKPLAAGECWIVPASLLFENDIRPQNINCFEAWGSTAFFKGEQGDLPFDILAASFYLLSRYEEYLPHQKDEYGRFAHTASLAYQQGFLQLPLVNIWLSNFADILRQKFPGLQLTPPAFRYVPTYDIDIAWSYFGKGFKRNAGGLLRDVFAANWFGVKERVKVMLAYADDPFDVYAWLDELHEKHGLQPLYFFLLAAKPGRYDKNTNPKHTGFRRLVHKLSAMYPAGIHPSWQSGDHPHLLQQELNTLNEMVLKPVVNSRQHYIRMQLPQTYQHLIAAGINNDYSMGYGSINGFRASYCLPFTWFDLSTNTPTRLTIFPFCYMEANSLFEQKLTPEAALSELMHYYHITRQFNGTLITIFHNHLLTQQPSRVCWRTMYETFLQNIGSAKK